MEQADPVNTLSRCVQLWELQSQKNKRDRCSLAIHLLIKSSIFHPSSVCQLLLRRVMGLLESTLWQTAGHPTSSPSHKHANATIFKTNCVISNPHNSVPRFLFFIIKSTEGKIFITETLDVQVACVEVTGYPEKKLWNSSTVVFYIF